MKNNTIGGVSPLKQRQSSRGGKSAGNATATSKRRGGFGKSTGKRGAGGRNVGGYNVQTSFVPSDPWKKPKSGGTTIMPEKPYTIGKDGKVEMNVGYEHKQDPDKVTKKESGGNFQRVWDANKDNFQDKWDDFDTWKKQAQKEIDEGYYDEKTVKGQKFKRKWSQKGDEDKVYDINDSTDSEGWYKYND